MCVIVHAGYRNVARNAFYANHYGFPIINSPIPPLVMIRGAPTNREKRRPMEATTGRIKGYHWAKQRPGATSPIYTIQ
ncbi:3-oxoacyl-(acyl-carrier-protein) synthase III, putative [Pseudomonas mandelii JR-1]|uniref:3-oxoacyl-(Acyl-carrier-protein) synthase III, putative n=1 Tax=Pseudomonas mandelii JR-1 TaxID=1147786 RepID=A0A024EHE1_9PSED|nr:3-oxoacyl-(acyl-carrier-protein) synthase III, putative [Pseudomonas mandelii JR-1]